MHPNKLYLQILTNPVDPETEILQDELIERLYIEGHMVTITTEIVTPQLLALEEQKRIREKAKAEAALELSVSESNAKEDKGEPPYNKKVTTTPEKATRQPLVNKLVKSRRRVSSLISVRLKSGELFKTSRELIEQLRAKAKKDNDDLVAMKLQAQRPPRLQIPFTDRLSNAVKRIQSSPSKKHVEEISLTGLRTNGKIHKMLKVRGALDKSTIALASTVRVKPKTSLVQQLESMSRLSDPQPAEISSPHSQPVLKHHQNLIPTATKNLHSSSHSQLVPVLMKWKSSSNHTKMLPLSTALQRIQTNTMHSDSALPSSTTNGNHTNGEVS